MQFSLNVTYVDGRYHGRFTDRELEMEWPPSPLRLFQALIAGSHRGAYGIVNQEVRDDALKWLESLEPPTVEVGSTVEAGAGLKNYLPNNDNLLDHIRSAEKPILAKVITGGGPVTYRWQFTNDEEAKTHARVICAMASLVTHLGQHQDTVYVRGDVTDAEATLLRAGDDRILYQPHQQLDGEWKSPDKGALAAFQKRYEGFLRGNSPFDYSIPSRGVRYLPSDSISFDAPLALFELWLEEGKRRKFESRDLRQPAAMVRNAMIEWLKENPLFRSYYDEKLGEMQASRLIAGHEPNQSNSPYGGAHIAFVPIPSLNENSTADGQIRRVLVIGYGCETGLALELFADAVSNLNGRRIKDNGKAIGMLRRAESETRDSVLRLFIGDIKPCRVWRTVTPIVLPGMTRRGRPASQLVLRALKQAGISESDVYSIATYSGPIVPKTVHALDYRVSGYLSDTRRYHAEVVFNRSVIGPLVIGRGRHSGLGLMMPFDEK